MKQFMVNLGIVYLGGFVFYCAVVLWFNRPSLRRQLAVLHNLNDGNVAYSNGLNAKIRDMGDMLQQNAYTIKEYDSANGDCRREIDSLEAKVARHEVTMKEYNKLLNESHTAVLEAQVEIRNATEALEFMKSELVMAERQLERLS